jgi:alkylation response protein AidB-like acyl-CoA dehydrogenase
MIFRKDAIMSLFSYQAPIKSMLHGLSILGYQHSVYDQKTAEALLESVGRFASEEIFPTNAIGDKVGLIYDPDSYSVKVPPSLNKVYQGIVSQGYSSIGLSAEIGGGGSPQVLAYQVMEILAASNISLSTCPLLTQGAVGVIDMFATPAIKQQYLPNMVSGVWTGTMCLTESQCGTDLGLIKSTAVSYGDHHKVSGTKIWITFGEHDLTENIIHLVLARLPSAPSGIHGISMFLVPKFRLDGSRNSAFCTGLEHKMGSKVSPTCFMSFDGAEAWLIGEPHKGMRAMFAMMNPARLSVGVQALGLSEIAYQVARTFAKDRRQSRSLDVNKRDMSADADVILVHPDVRRMLLNARCFNEGFRALVTYTAMCLDRGDMDRVALITPVIKSYGSEEGMASISDSLQVLGGAGYTQDWMIEQFLRDGRITMIYEGTNGIQALDLVGRKLPKNQGKAMLLLIQQMRTELSGGKGPCYEGLAMAIDELEKCNVWLLTNGLKDPEQVAAVAGSYLKIFALTLLSWMWCKLAASDEAIYANLSEYFLNQHLDKIKLYSKRLLRGKSIYFCLNDSDF